MFAFLCAVGVRCEFEVLLDVDSQAPADGGGDVVALLYGVLHDDARVNPQRQSRLFLNVSFVSFKFWGEAIVIFEQILLNRVPYERANDRFVEIELGVEFEEPSYEFGDGGRGGGAREKLVAVHEAGVPVVDDEVVAAVPLQPLDGGQHGVGRLLEVENDEHRQSVVRELPRAREVVHFGPVLDDHLEIKNTNTNKCIIKTRFNNVTSQ